MKEKVGVLVWKTHNHTDVVVVYENIATAHERAADLNISSPMGGVWDVEIVEVVEE